MVLHRDTETKHKDRIVRWVCKCECGTIASVSGASLRNGDSKSCGCYKIEKLTTQKVYQGEQSGLLTVIKRTHDIQKYGRRTTMILCQCECGNKVEIRLADFVSGDVRSCGCLSTSINEVNVRKYLTEHNIPFVEQANFPDCVGESGWRLYYDFYIPRKKATSLFIECQGNQHYKPIDYFGGQEVFEHIVINDNAKRLYAKKRNISLIEIDCSKRPSKTQIYKELDRIAERFDLMNYDLY